MPTPNEIQRIAGAMHALRPEWGFTSLVTFLTNHHSTRAYRDLTIAAVAVAADPITKTPRLLNTHGAWWVAAQAGAGTTAGESTTIAKCAEPGHTSFYAHNCGSCRAEQLEGERVNQQPRVPSVSSERVRQILEQAL